MKTNRGLGKGLSALFSDTEEAYEKAYKNPILGESAGEAVNGQPVVNTAGAASAAAGVANTANIANAAGVANTAVEIEISLIDANPNQPRKVFDDAAMKELADSILQNGVVQPIILVKKGSRYMIIAGERRWRATRLAGLKTIPAIVKNYTERQIKEISLIENLQREDLNPIEAAAAIKQLMDEYNATQEEIADKIGKARSTVTNLIRLLSLSPEVIKLVANNRLSAGHARALITLPAAAQYEIALYACDNQISVREIEQKVRDYLNPPEVVVKREKTKEEISIELKDMITQMQRCFGTKVGVMGNDKKGRIFIDYYTRDDLDRIEEIVSKSLQVTSNK